MTAEEATERVLAALRAEVRRHRGQIAQKEARLGRSSGYLSKVLRRSLRPSLDVVMRILEVFDVDPGELFGRALDVAASPEAFLADLAEGSDAVRHDAVPSEGDGSEPPWSEEGREEGSEEGAREMAGRSTALARLSRGEQLRRLRADRRLRHPDFVTAYLAVLDALRYEKPEDALPLAGHVASELVPRLGSGLRRRVLQCRALGVLGSCHRMSGDAAAAAGALRQGLFAARRHAPPEVVAELLQRGAYVLFDRRLFARARSLLRDALTIYFDLEDGAGIARTLVDRGILSGYAGADREAIALLARARRSFPARGVLPPGPRYGVLERNREAVYHHLVLAHTALGELEAADEWLREAEAVLGRGGRIGTRLAWQRGKILLARRDPEGAVYELARVFETFDERRDPDAVLAFADLLLALFAAGRGHEAQRLASDRRPAGCRGSARAVAVELERAARHRRMTPSLVRHAAGVLQKRGNAPR